MREFTDGETIDWLVTLEKRMSSAAIALYSADGRVLVVKAHYKKYWSFPGGVIDAGETPRNAAIREVREEVGIDIDADRLSFKIAVDRLSSIAQTYQFIFDEEVGSALFEHIQLDRDEIEDFALVTREQIMSRDRYYSQTTIKWAEGYTGYLEQQFRANTQGDI